ncbi:MAG: hypothetical protein AAGI63_14305 [Planctomycetota bacterium]
MSNRNTQSSSRLPSRSDLRDGSPEVRMTQASSSRLTHEAFLELIVQDELAVRRDRLINRRTNATNFPAAAAILDRYLKDARLVEMTGKSYRLRRGGIGYRPNPINDTRAF